MHFHFIIIQEIISLEIFFFLKKPSEKIFQVYYLIQTSINHKGNYDFKYFEKFYFSFEIIICHFYNYMIGIHLNLKLWYQLQS